MIPKGSHIYLIYNPIEISHKNYNCNYQIIITQSIPFIVSLPYFIAQRMVRGYDKPFSFPPITYYNSPLFVGLEKYSIFYLLIRCYVIYRCLHFKAPPLLSVYMHTLVLTGSTSFFLVVGILHDSVLL